MADRDFTEVELRAMLEKARRYRADIVPDRWVIEAVHAGRSWEVIVEPDVEEGVLVVVTAYPIER